MSQALQAIRDRIAAAARKAGRSPSDITLTAVSKQQPWEAIAPVLAAGQTVFGENRVREARHRWQGRRQGLELRLIGPLQTNKAREAVEFFDVIETLDREKLCRALADAIQAAGRAPRLLIQVNIGREPQKAGILPENLDGLLTLARRDYGLGIEGLMCIPPVDEPPEPHFAALAAMARRHDLSVLSMGMSEDFDKAVIAGATHVRVGSALFGSRTLATTQNAT